MRFYETMIRMSCKKTVFLAIGPAEMWTRNGADEIFKKQLERKQAMLLRNGWPWRNCQLWGYQHTKMIHVYSEYLSSMFMSLDWEFISNGLSPIRIQVSVRIGESVNDEVEEYEYEIRDDLESAGVREVKGRDNTEIIRVKYKSAAPSIKCNNK